jgi:NAD(P)-dependent dehydrogenase (short-subunit alcohol dehydrogenase family)
LRTFFCSSEKKLSIAAFVAGRSDATHRSDHEMPIEMWDHMFAVNTRGAFNAMKFQIPHLLAGGGGAIVLTGSMIQHASRPNAAAYAASKLALEGFGEICDARLWPAGAKSEHCRSGND